MIVGCPPLVVSSAAVLAVALHGRRVAGLAPVIICNKTLQRAAGPAPAPGQPQQWEWESFSKKKGSSCTPAPAPQQRNGSAIRKNPSHGQRSPRGRPPAAAAAPQQGPQAALARPGCSDTSCLAQQPPGPRRAKQGATGGTPATPRWGHHHITRPKTGNDEQAGRWLREGVGVGKVGAGLGVAVPCPWIAFSLQKRDQRAFQVWQWGRGLLSTYVWKTA